VTGNDIVDLSIAKTPEGVRIYRFLQKIFSIEEQELINSGRVGIWTIWAMKEAVYKAHHRRFNLPRSFDPTRIHVQFKGAFENTLLAQAKYLGYDYWGKGQLTSEYVHFTATGLPQEQLYRGIYNTPSIDIKAQLKLAICREMDLEMKELEIIKNNNLIPNLMYRNIPLRLPFSISHHGKFTAYSLQLMNY